MKLSKLLGIFFIGLLGPMIILYISFMQEMTSIDATELTFGIYIVMEAFCLLGYNYLENASPFKFDRKKDTPQYD